MLVKTSGIIVPKNHPKTGELKAHLTRDVVDFNDNVNRYLFYEILQDGSMLIPRYYPIGEDVDDQSMEGEVINISSTITPRNQRQENAINFLTGNTKGILRLEPGSGKTVVTIEAISRLKRKAIIFAHKDKLLESGWKREFLANTNLTEDQIGRLYSGNYQKELDKPIILSTPHIIANAVKNKNQEFLDALNNANIGIMVVDECHVGIGPEHFSKSSIGVPAKYTWGLSATPKRGDGNEDILEYHLGKVTYFPPEENEMLNPLIYMVYFPFEIFSKHRAYLSWGGRFSPARYYQQQKKSTVYMNKMVKYINDAWMKERTSLVLGMRIETLLLLAKQCGAPKKDIGIFIPGSNEKQRLEVSDTADLDEAFFTKKIVFSTYQAARDGNNRKDLDTLIMSCPTSNVEQAVGRIMRELKGKKRPIVVDAVDTEGPLVYSKALGEKTNYFIRSAENRKLEYARLGWEVKELKAETSKQQGV